MTRYEGDGDPIEGPAERRVAQRLGDETQPDEHRHDDPLDDLQSTLPPSGLGSGTDEPRVPTTDLVDDDTR